MGRSRKNYPDATTPEGQWAWWLLYHMPADCTAQDLADGVGVGRTVAYEWLSGQSVPGLSRWPDIAKWLGLKPIWQALVPPDDFVRYVRRSGKLPSDSRFK